MTGSSLILLRLDYSLAPTRPCQRSKNCGFSASPSLYRLHTQIAQIAPVTLFSRYIAAMFCIRRAALRALSSPYRSVSTRPRSITTYAPSVLRQIAPVSISPFQRRFASEEVTQAEPVADGASGAQHGENATASSTYGTSNEETLAPGDANVSSSQQEQQSVATAQETESADPEDHNTITSAISSTTESLTANASQAADSLLKSTQSARESVADAAAAIGVGTRATDAIAGRNTSQKSTSEPPPSLYVGNLFFDVTEENLRKEMERFGPVKNVKIILDGRGLSKGFGYVDYEDAVSADNAIANLNQQVFEGRRMTVQYSIKKQRTSVRDASTGARNPPAKTLFIGNMSFEMTDKDLNDLFREIKNVIDVRVAIDRKTGQPRGFAHADFIDIASAEKAREILEDREIYGRKLRIDYSISNVGTRTRESTS